MDRKAREAAAIRKVTTAAAKTPDEDDDTNAKKKVKKKPIHSSRGAPPSDYNPMQPWTASRSGGGYKYVSIQNIRNYSIH